ncbi:glutamate carboxypeptidase [Sediminicola sp. YIK13]|uniref:M28 family peptidase n=1 Tax=Sediminicola sp. YIK13 TaxID=1453352 RepID=UPI000720245C|nr:M28 family peptidase [Sediminicola sp. YIK13]ALM07561.1 glutamate carboxypeptidase [Sediminicola sp. YIK13]
MRRLLVHIVLFSFSYLATAQSNDGFLAQSQTTEKQVEDYFLKTVDFDQYKIHLKTLTQKPHVAGSKANEEVRDYMANVMKNAGLKVELYPYDIYMSKNPGSSLIELVTPIREPLNQQEFILEGDAYSSSADLWKGWNAYSGSGDVTAEVVYANYGTKEDFEKLKELGVSVKGKIVLARYGQNFRGYKAKFAEENGAAGLIIYTDPADSGFTKGLVYPEGVYSNESAIQRGSVLTEEFTGDPLTPYEPALPLDGKKKIKRLDPKDTNMHTIPVTPIGYGSAQKILGLMSGKVVPEGWQGGLPFTYRLDGGDELKLRLMVDQKRDFVRVHNVVGTIKGTEYPDEWIILGCHYDAWGYGATDPNSGTAMLLGLSESLGKLAKEGKGPKRSILIAHWDAEEHGVIGSAEWVEQMKDELNAKAVAYLNFDGGVSGKKFGASASPTLKKVLVEASKEVNYPETEKTVYEVWKGDKDAPKIGNLGGGSDHIGFYMHVGVPSLSGGTSGPTLYHTNYDSFGFYEKFVDPSFKMGPMVEQLVGIMTLRLANAEIIPYDVKRYATDLKLHFEKATAGVKSFDTNFEGFDLVDSSLVKLEEVAARFETRLTTVLNNGSLSKNEINSINSKMLALEKSFIDSKGMYYGDWYKSLYASTDPFSGYASWMLPGIEYEISLKSSDRLEEWDMRYSKAIDNLSSKINVLISELN